MICTTIINKDLEGVLAALERCEMAEIRLDSCDLSMKDIDEVFSSDVPLVATCRIADIMANDPSLRDLPLQSREIRAMQKAERLLVRAIEAGARYVDVEMEAQKQMSKRVRNAAHENGTVFIRSYHDFDGTDSLEALKALVEKCCYHGADVVKLVTTAHSEEDADRVMSLYSWVADENAHAREAGESVGKLADGGLIAFCMGEAGRNSRLDCLKHGSPYTYAALTAEEAAAPGQWPMDEMMTAVYGNTEHAFAGKPWKIPTSKEVPSTLLLENCGRSSQESACTSSSQGALQMPCSKSFAQRAIIAAALADGTSHLRGYSPCGDNEAALQVARLLGADVQKDGSEITIKGISASQGSLGQILDAEGQPSVMEDGTPRLHVGESGLLTRMMIPLMTQLCPGKVSFTGEKTLLGRPLTGAKEIMDAFGAEAESCEGCLDFARYDSVEARHDKVKDRYDKEGHTGQTEIPSEVLRVPLTVKGPLKPGRTEISGKHGSQIISGLLMALPFADRNSTIVVHEPKSIPYMFITLEVLKKFGIKVGNEMLGGRDFLESDGDWSLCTEMVFKVKGGQRFRAADIDLEADWSAAANFLVAGAVFGKVELMGLDTTSLQADLSIMDILMDAGASLSQMDGDRGNITAQRAPLRAFNVDASNCPDLFPIISVLAAFCQGTSRLAGVGRLANKESDRAKAIIEMLTQMGVRAWIEGDEMMIEGHSLVQRLLCHGKDSICPSGVNPERSAGLLRGGEYTSHHDHRMVMALKVASLGADSPIIIDDEQCVGKSFPQFHETFAEMRRHLNR